MLRWVRYQTSDTRESSLASGQLTSILFRVEMRRPTQATRPKTKLQLLTKFKTWWLKQIQKSSSRHLLKRKQLDWRAWKEWPIPRWVLKDRGMRRILASGAQRWHRSQSSIRSSHLTVPASYREPIYQSWLQSKLRPFLCRLLIKLRSSKRQTGVIMLRRSKFATDFLMQYREGQASTTQVALTQSGYMNNLKVLHHPSMCTWLAPPPTHISPHTRPCPTTELQKLDYIKFVTK